MKIKNKEDIINHFIAGSKNHQNIRVENEKFIFDNKSKKRSKCAPPAPACGLYLFDINY